MLVKVVNVNDNSPKFNASLYNYTFDEEVPKAFVIAQVKVSDIWFFVKEIRILIENINLIK